jgi:hypothetical protein
MAIDPHFENPPVVERVIGLQFNELPFYTNAHAGWFWKTYLDSEWSVISEAPSIQNQIERFGDKKIGVSKSQLQIATNPRPERHRIVRESDDRMIQIQNSRFHLNWKRKDGQDYPDFEALYDEFMGYFKVFSEFVKSADKDVELIPNQWEITYINHIPKGDLWESISDWFNVFPGLSIPILKSHQKNLDTLNTQWSITLNDNIGRLHVKLNHAIAPKRDNNEEIILLDLTARGPISKEADFDKIYQLGHDAIVTTFTEITSDYAHKTWRRTS